MLPSGRPLPSTHLLETILNLIGATTTNSGLEVYARLDDGTYPDKIHVPDAELGAVNLCRHRFHPDWNYTINHDHLLEQALRVDGRYLGPQRCD